MSCPKGAFCFVSPIWHDEHEYDAKRGTCRRKAECTACGLIEWSAADHECLGGGDGDLCLERLLAAGKSVK